MKRGSLKIAVDARVLGQRGVGRYLANLLRALAETREDLALRLYLGPSSVEGALPKDPRFSVERLGQAHPAWAEQVLIPRRARAWGAQVLHYPDNSGALDPGLPMALTLHDTLWRRPLGAAIARPTGRQRLQDLYRKFVCPRAARAAAVVLTVSRYSADDIAASLGLPQARLRCAPSGLDPVFARRLAPAAALRLAQGLGLDRPYVLASGAADKRKNIDRLIQAFAQARNTDPRLAHALLAISSLRPGEAATTNYLATAKAAGIADSLRFLPYVSDEQMKALYQRALCFAFPSLGEGFGLPLLEAFSMGCPVLSADGTALPEVAGKAAVYADPLDVASLARGLSLAASPQGRAARVALGRARLKRFSWKASARVHLDAYFDAAAQGSRP
ncbi:MAG TPA: glycosyltransferase family 1 protein [bacterium]|jgi:glycosyltransferase involved in cell wall biosynthesis|nr:glycosyltransferase family 1 protein [bacterium]